MTGGKKWLALLAAPLLAAFAASSVVAHSQEAPAAPPTPFEETINEAKASMMADSAAALDLARKAKGLVQGEDRPAEEARLTAQWLEAEALMRLNRADEAAEIISAALKKTQTEFKGSKLHADLLRSKAGLSVLQGQYGNALSAFLEAHELYGALDEDRSRAIVLQNIGSLYADARDYPRVLSYYRQASEAFPGDVALELSSHNNIGNAYKELGRFEEAEVAFLSALATAEKMDSPLLEARILTNIASTQYLAGDYSKAERTVERGLRIAYESAPEWRPFLYGVRAQIALARGNRLRAEDYLARTFANEDLTATSPYFRDFHETAYKVYSAAGQYNLALEHFAAFHRIDDEARELSATANNALLAARFDVANRDLKISKLSAESEANEARLDVAQNQVILLSLVVAMAILAFAAALFVLRTVNRSRKAMKEVNAKLTHVIQHDPLTQLYAREHFRVLFEEVITRADTAKVPPILAFIDLDRFKQVNDVFGHAAGDKLLIQVAERFRDAASEETVIGRLGGDEFAMVMPPGMPLEDAIALSNRIIYDVAEPFQIDGFEISIGASIGLTQITETGSTSAHMTNADLALYAAKDRGRGNCAVYEPKMRDKLEDRSSLEKDLESALEKGELSVCYQPIVRGGDHSIMGYEALMRWHHPERGIVPPSIFIPVAEDGRLIERLGAWLLRESCTEAASWPDDIKLTVNVSPMQLNDAEFLHIVTQALASSGLPPERLILELTERMVLEMDKHLEKLLAGLRNLGVSFALDDFGRGYSSLNYIEQMHFAMIKIDREFVHSAAEGSARSMAVVAAIIALARSLNIDVTAEGIERESQAKAMAELGCTCFQGYHFGRPSTSIAKPAKNRRAGTKRAAA